MRLLRYSLLAFALTFAATAFADSPKKTAPASSSGKKESPPSDSGKKGSTPAKDGKTDSKTPDKK